MARLDEDLRRQLERAARPADPSGLYEHLIRRKERRRMLMQMQKVGVVVVALAVSLGGLAMLSRAFRDGDPPVPVAPSLSNGVIVFSRDIAGQGEQLFAASPDGSGFRRLTPEGRAIYRSPDVSPDGRMVVVAHAIPSFEPGQAVLATVPIEGGSPEWLTEESWRILDPAWSPDGERIAFAGSARGPFGIYVFDVETKDVRLVPGTDEISVGHPAWSPDGDRIAFEASTDPDTDPSRSWDVLVADLDGSNTVNLTATPGASETHPAWSWTTNRIALVRSEGSRAGLFTIAADGGPLVRIPDGELRPTNPEWSPDGALIAFEGTDGDRRGVFIVAGDGSGLLAVPNIQGSEPSWQPLQQDASTAPSPSPTESSDSQVGQEIGLGLRLCDVTSVRGRFLGEGGRSQTALVGIELVDGACPNGEEVTGVVAIDLTGDGLADVASEPFECQGGCRAYAAPDVDGDGTDELLAVNVEFTIMGLRLFDVLEVDGGPALLAVTVEPPGDAALGSEGFDGSGPPQFWIGGDAFVADSLRCEARPGGRVLVSTTAESLPHDSPDAVWQIHETTFELEHGVLRVAEARDLEEPAGLGTTPSFMSTSGCGADLDAAS